MSEFDRSPRFFDDPPADREAEPGSVLGGHEGFHQGFALVGGNAGAIVLDLDDEMALVVVEMRSYADMTIDAGCIAGVDHQIQSGVHSVSLIFFQHGQHYHLAENLAQADILDIGFYLIHSG